MTTKLLIEKAKKLAGKRKLTTDVNIGHVGCALQTKSGKVYTGISITTSASMGLCAEISAMAQMLKDSETEIEMIVAANEKGQLITPCGKCREFIYQINYKNLKTKILLDEGRSLSLEELLPHRWQDYWGGKRKVTIDVVKLV